MTFSKWLFAALLLLPVPAAAQSSLLIRPDRDAWVEVDGKPASQIPFVAWTVYEIAVAPGEHLVTALTTDRRDRWEAVVNVMENNKTFVLVSLATLNEEREVKESADRDDARQRAQIAELERKLGDLRRRLGLELTEARQAEQAADMARNNPAPTNWLRALNDGLAKMSDTSAQKHRGNAEQLQVQISELEHQIDGVRVGGRF